ncbi:DnaA regulatory inactivator Hda [Acinetobacter sp. MD2(2019)]|uniref:DnaA regulatory inactivator Hda n=1 Tax=Acinetobacter sp. MD2(2019) TaxID=2605273 RepID=UPI002D1EAA22|nr:DnaA regulatory inactivator Hda [Acinetobacter sp. MD2(2019)]MEB3753478.1 DnaA regulatory inactivator Hda [Acinetobacter sp. MD2(2019)]
MRQLQLDIEPQLDARISDFSGPSWGHVIDAIRQLHAGLMNRFYVYGGAGTGKSHLLSAICDSYLEIGKSAIHVSLLELLDAPIEAITCLERYDLVALDDIEAISGVLHWQKAIFHLINYNNQEGGQLVFSSRYAPIELKLELPDLQSRLTQAVSVKLPSGSLYADRQALVMSVLLRRGVHLDQQIIDYLLLHGPHQASQLLQAVERLEKLLKGEKTKLSNANLRQIYALIDEYQQIH